MDWLARQMVAVFRWLHGAFSNYGMAVILLTLLIKAALHQLNAALRLVRGTTRGPFSTAVQARVSCRHSHCRFPALLGRKGGWAGGELHASGCLPLL